MGAGRGWRTHRPPLLPQGAWGTPPADAASKGPKCRHHRLRCGGTGHPAGAQHPKPFQWGASGDRGERGRLALGAQSPTSEPGALPPGAGGTRGWHSRRCPPTQTLRGPGSGKWPVPHRDSGGLRPEVWQGLAVPARPEPEAAPPRAGPQAVPASRLASGGRDSSRGRLGAGSTHLWDDSEDDLSSRAGVRGCWDQLPCPRAAGRAV